jgi:hypothetical protein
MYSKRVMLSEGWLTHHLGFLENHCLSYGVEMARLSEFDLDKQTDYLSTMHQLMNKPTRVAHYLLYNQLVLKANHTRRPHRFESSIYPYLP